VPAPKSNPVTLKAIAAALEGDPNTAANLAQETRDPAVVKLIEWLNVTENWKAVGFNRIVAFIFTNPGWPSLELLNRRAERLWFEGKPPAERVLEHFAGRSPVSPEGRIALARARRSFGGEKGAETQIVQAWYEVKLTTAGRKAILAEFGSLITRERREERLWRLIYGRRPEEAIETARHISDDHVKAAIAAADLIRERAAGLALYNSLPASLRNEPALLNALARYYRRTDRVEQARDILLRAPSSYACARSASALPKCAVWSSRRAAA
jgi:soluble lytic murein transglycosylase